MTIGRWGEVWIFIRDLLYGSQGTKGGRSVHIGPIASLRWTKDILLLWCQGYTSKEDIETCADTRLFVRNTRH